METKEVNKTVRVIVLQHKIDEVTRDLILKYTIETGLIPKKITIENIPCRLESDGTTRVISHVQLEDLVEFSVSPEVLSEST